MLQWIKPGALVIRNVLRDDISELLDQRELSVFRIKIAEEPQVRQFGLLRQRSEQVRDGFTTEWNTALETLAPQVNPSTDAFTEHADVVLLNYPEQLHDPQRTTLLPPHAFLGSAVRRQNLPADIERWLDEEPTSPIVYVSFGTTEIGAESQGAHSVGIYFSL